MLKIIFKKYKKYFFYAFQSEKHFEKQPQPHFQTRCRDCGMSRVYINYIFIKYLNVVSVFFLNK